MEDENGVVVWGSRPRMPRRGVWALICGQKGTVRGLQTGL